MLASVFEAVVAAVYQDSDLATARAFMEREFGALISRLDKDIEYATDFKTRLQEYAQKRWRVLPEYRLLASQGPEHAKSFTYEVWIGDESYGQGEGNSRKAAEQEAAKAALRKIGDKV